MKGKEVGKKEEKEIGMEERMKEGTRGKKNKIPDRIFPKNHTYGCNILNLIFSLILDTLLTPTPHAFKRFTLF